MVIIKYMAEYHLDILLPKIRFAGEAIRYLTG